MKQAKFYLILFDLIYSISCSSWCIDEPAYNRLVKYYYDEKSNMCLAFRSDCLQSKLILYDTLKECSTSRMPHHAKKITLSCAQNQYILSSSNDNIPIPYVFSSIYCQNDGKSEFCSHIDGEYCHSFKPYAYCCVDNINGETKYAVRSSFVVTGITNFTFQQESEFPKPAPVNCNLDGKRTGIEWYANTNKSDYPTCFARRDHCRTPGTKRIKNIQTYRTAQDCMNKEFPNHSVKYVLRCSKGYGIVKYKGEPIIARGDECRGIYDSDLCDRNELCFGNTNFKYCCNRKSEENEVTHKFTGKNFMASMTNNRRR